MTKTKTTINMMMKL